MALADWRDRSIQCDGRAVAIANFHLTLAFLGELQPARLDPLLDAADRLLERHTGSHRGMMIDQVGYWSKPGMYWAGPRVCPDAVSQIADALRGLVVQFGARRERTAFQPHITLFRRCQTPPAAPSVPPAIELAAPSVALFESRQGRDGVSYQPLAEWR